MRPIVRLLLLLAIVAGAYYAYKHFAASAPAGGDAHAAMGAGGAAPVSVAAAIERKVQQWNEYSGRLVAVDQADIRPRVSGTVDSIHFKNGDLVKKGDLLFVIDPRPFEAAVSAASARAATASSEYERAKKLMVDKALSQRDFDQRKNDALVARAELTKAQLDLDYTHIKAPITGKVGRAEITVGNLVEAGPSAPLLTSVVASTPIYADFEVDEDAYLQYSRSGVESAKIPVLLLLDGETPVTFEGQVESFDNRLNTESGTIRVRAVVPNEKGVLVPGLFTRVKLGTPTDGTAVLISERALGTDQNKKFVLVVGDDNKVAYREVKLGGMADGMRVVSEGLKAGEKIVVSGMQRAHPGAQITPEVVAMEEQLTPSSGKPAPEGAEKK